METEAARGPEEDGDGVVGRPFFGVSKKHFFISIGLPTGLCLEAERRRPWRHQGPGESPPGCGIDYCEYHHHWARSLEDLCTRMLELHPGVDVQPDFIVEAKDVPQEP